MLKLISLKTEIARSVRGPKLQRALCRRRNGGAVPRAEIFADLITADHKVLSDNYESRNNHRYAVVVQVRHELPMEPPVKRGTRFG